MSKFYALVCKLGVLCLLQEMQQQMSVLNQKPALPDMSEMITNYLSGGQKPIKAKKTTKK